MEKVEVGKSLKDCKNLFWIIQFTNDNKIISTVKLLKSVIYKMILMYPGLNFFCFFNQLVSSIK